MANNKTVETIIYDNVQSTNVKTVKPTAAYSVLSDDNLVICGANSVAVTLDGNSNSPVYVTSVDGTTQRTSCTLLVNGNTYKIEDGGMTAQCIRVAGTALWVIVGAKSIS